LVGGVEIPVSVAILITTTEVQSVLDAPLKRDTVTIIGAASNCECDEQSDENNFHFTPTNYY
jgi:hypothetical protein